MGVLSAAVRAAKAAERAKAAQAAQAAKAAAAAARAQAAAAKAAPGGLLRDWNWRPEAEVAKELSLTEVPRYIQDGYGKFMLDQGKRIDAGQLGARDIAKAYTITRSSVGRTSRKINDNIAQGSVRPEGYMAEWLLTPQGKAYLDDAQRGVANTGAISDLVARFKPFGMADTLGEDLQRGALSLPSKVPALQQALQGGIADWRSFAQDMYGIGPAKSGFAASLLGKGYLPTLDARQLVLQTGNPADEATKYMSRMKGKGVDQAVDRLAERQSNLGLALDPELEPHRQHLTHHTIWDRVANERTTHDDLVRAMRLAGMGGAVAVGAGLLGEEPD